MGQYQNRLQQEETKTAIKRKEKNKNKVTTHPFTRKSSATQQSHNIQIRNTRSPPKTCIHESIHLQKKEEAKYARKFSAAHRLCNISVAHHSRDTTN